MDDKINQSDSLKRYDSSPFVRLDVLESVGKAIALDICHQKELPRKVDILGLETCTDYLAGQVRIQLRKLGITSVEVRTTIGQNGADITYNSDERYRSRIEEILRSKPDRRGYPYYLDDESNSNEGLPITLDEMMS